MSPPEQSSAPEPDVIVVDLSRCVGHGKCYGVAPELMRPFDDEGHAEFHADAHSPSDPKRIARANKAIESCPERALSWRWPAVQQHA